MFIGEMYSRRGGFHIRPKRLEFCYFMGSHSSSRPDSRHFSSFVAGGYGIRPYGVCAPMKPTDKSKFEISSKIPTHLDTMRGSVI